MECACHKNKAKNISLLYNLPGPSLGVEASRPSRPRKRVGHDGKKPRERRENSKVPSCKDSRTQLCEDRKKSSSGSDTDIFQCIEIIHVLVLQRSLIILVGPTQNMISYSCILLMLCNR